MSSTVDQTVYIYVYVVVSQSSQVNGALVDEVVVAWDEIGSSSSSSSSRNGCRQ